MRVLKLFTSEQRDWCNERFPPIKVSQTPVKNVQVRGRKKHWLVVTVVEKRLFSDRNNVVGGPREIKSHENQLKAK